MPCGDVGEARDTPGGREERGRGGREGGREGMGREGGEGEGGNSE